MVKTLFFLIVVLFFEEGFSQINSTDVLKEFLRSEDFCKYVLPCDKCDSIIVVDTAGFFKNESFFVSGKKVVINSIGYPAHVIPTNDAELLRRSCSSLLVTKYEKQRKGFRIDFFHFPTNGIGWVSYKFKHGKLKKTGFGYGQL